MWHTTANIEHVRAHVEQCVHQLRGKRVALDQFVREIDTAQTLVSSAGMLRVASMREGLPWTGPPGSCFVASVVVLEQYRGRGEADRLIRALIARYGRRVLVLGVDPTNQAATALYAKWGWRIAQYRNAHDACMIRAAD